MNTENIYKRISKKAKQRISNYAKAYDSNMIILTITPFIKRYFKVSTLCVINGVDEIISSLYDMVQRDNPHYLSQSRELIIR